MRSSTTEFKVGLFVLVALILMVGGYLWSIDGVRPDEASYTLRMSVATADGLNRGTPVRIAGIEVGSIETIEVAGDRADIVLRIREAYQLPVGTDGDVKASGLLGDKYVRIYPSNEDALLKAGDRIKSRDQAGDLDIITKNFERISDDIASITAILRKVIEKEENVDHVESTLANVDALTGELRGLAERNSQDIDAIVDSVRRLSESLERYAGDIAADVDDEMDRLKDLTDDLDVAAEDISSITGKMDRGEGTIGALLNDRTTIDNLNRTVKNVDRAVGSLFGLRPMFYYTGRFYAGTEPADTVKFPTGNELAWSGSNTIGIRLQAKSDFWYLVEFVDHPQGTVTQKEVYREATNTFETRWTRERGFKFTFQIEKRWGNASVRVGLREGGGGAGVTGYFLRDRLQLHFDLFSLRFGSYPAVAESGVPNTRLFLRWQPLRNVYFEAGAEQIVLGIKNGYFTGYLGVGFMFYDNNLRSILSVVPGAL